MAIPLNPLPKGGSAELQRVGFSSDCDALRRNDVLTYFPELVLGGKYGR